MIKQKHGYFKDYNQHVDELRYNQQVLQMTADFFFFSNMMQPCS